VITILHILTGMLPSIPVEVFVLTPQEVENRLAAGDQFIEEIMEKGKILYSN